MGYKKKVISSAKKDEGPKRSFSGKKSYGDKPAFKKKYNIEDRFSRDREDKPAFRPRSSERDSRGEGERRPFRKTGDKMGADGKIRNKSVHSPRNPKWEARPDWKKDNAKPSRERSRDSRSNDGDSKQFRRPDRNFGDKKRRDDSRPSHKDFKREDRPEIASGEDTRPSRENYSHDISYGREPKLFRRPSGKFGDKRRGDSKPFEERRHKWGDKPERTNETRTPGSSESRDLRPDDRERKPFRRPGGKSGDEKRTPRPRFNKDERNGDGEKKWNRKSDSEFYGDRRKGPPTRNSFKKSFKQPREENDGTTRLNKFISNAGICSRREADELITAGVVSVNGEVIIELGYKVKPEDVVKYNNEVLRSEKMVYILLNKPKDFITTADDPEKRKTVMNLIANACKERVYPVGRLDRNTTGLLILTNDGDLTRKLTHPSFEVQKIYQVELDNALKAADMESIEKGLHLEDGFVKVDAINYVGTGQDKAIVGIEIHSGRNRIVRRIFESLGYEVKKLDRVYFAGISKKDLPRGRWRFLSELEVASLKIMTGSKKFKNLAPEEPSTALE